MRNALSVAAALGLMVAPHAALAQDAAAQPAQTQGEQTAAAVDQGRFLTPQSFSDLAKAKLPAVVSIITTQRVEAGPPGRRQLPPGMEDFMRRFGIPQGPGQGPPPGARNALGSGFVIDADGHVVTNNHVVESADTVDVVLNDGTKLQAEIVGTDARTDLALLKVAEPSKLPADLDWGSSEDAEVGDWVMAIGNPFGLGGTVTTGVISARARNLGSGPYDDYLQTDASINRGNSGGPLINMQGQVVGVNTAIFSPTGGSVGIGFAVPSSIAESVIAQLKETGQVERGWLGVQIQPVTEDIATALGLEQDQGALVSDVTPGSPAAEAGVRAGDVILRFDGTDIKDLRDLTLAVAETPVGQQVEMQVLRDGERTTLNPQIALLEDQGGTPTTGGGPAGETGRLGLALAPLTPELRAEFGLPEAVEGALVAEVEPGSPAFEHGLMPGDVILRVAGKDVRQPSDVVEAVTQARESDRESVLVLRQRADSKAFVALPLGDADAG